MTYAKLTAYTSETNQKSNQMCVAMTFCILNSTQYTFT